MKKIRLTALQQLSIEQTNMDNQIAQADISISLNTLANEIKTFVEKTASIIRLNLWKESAYCKMYTELPIYSRVEINVDNVRLEYFILIKFNDFYELDFMIDNETESIKDKMLNEISWRVLLNENFRN